MSSPPSILRSSKSPSAVSLARQGFIRAEKEPYKASIPALRVALYSCPAFAGQYTLMRSRSGRSCSNPYGSMIADTVERKKHTRIYCTFCKRLSFAEGITLNVTQNVMDREFNSQSLRFACAVRMTTTMCDIAYAGRIRSRGERRNRAAGRSSRSNMQEMPFAYAISSGRNTSSKRSPVRKPSRMQASRSVRSSRLAN